MALCLHHSKTLATSLASSCPRSADTPTCASSSAPSALMKPFHSVDELGVSARVYGFSTGDCRGVVEGVECSLDFCALHITSDENQSRTAIVCRPCVQR